MSCSEPSLNVLYCIWGYWTYNRFCKVYVIALRESDWWFAISWLYGIFRIILKWVTCRPFISENKSPTWYRKTPSSEHCLTQPTDALLVPDISNRTHTVYPTCSEFAIFKVIRKANNVLVKNEEKRRIVCNTQNTSCYFLNDKQVLPYFTFHH